MGTPPWNARTGEGGRWGEAGALNVERFVRDAWPWAPQACARNVTSDGHAWALLDGVVKSTFDAAGEPEFIYGNAKCGRVGAQGEHANL